MSKKNLLYTSSYIALTFFSLQSLPFYFAHIVFVFAIVLGFAFSTTHKRIRLISVALVVASISVSLFFWVQSRINLSSHLHIFTNIANPEYREALTLGSYQVSGAVSLDAVARFLSIIMFATLLRENLTKLAELDIYCIKSLTDKVIKTLTILQLFCYALALFGYSEILRAIFQSAHDGFLAQGDIGFRASIGFTEPSLLAVYISVLLHVFHRLVGSEKRICGINIVYLYYIFFVVTTYSATMLILYPALNFIDKIFKLRSMKYILIFIGFFVVLMLFDSNGSGESIETIRQLSPIFRSVGDRFGADLLALNYEYLFGIDFGQVYSFIPVFSLILPIGFIGLLVLQVVMRKYFKTPMLSTLLILSVVPQLWFSVGIISLSMYSMLVRQK